LFFLIVDKIDFLFITANVGNRELKFRFKKTGVGTA